MKKIISVLFLFCFVFSTSLFAYDFSAIFNKNISTEELAKLANSETIIRNIGTVKKLSLTESNNEWIKSIHAELNKSNPNYLAEIIRVVPKEGNEFLFEQIYNAILDIESYTEIPYFSEQQQCWYNLYESATINSISETENNKDIKFTVEMLPFNIFDMYGQLQKKDNSLYYKMVNETKVVYASKNITCVKPKNMVSSIVFFEYDDYYVLYGIGAVDAPSIFFLKDRIETSFIGRIKYFCKYMFEQINIR